MSIKKLERDEILSHPIVLEIINNLNLNKNQIDSGIELFAKIIDENENISIHEFITKIEIYDEKTVVGVSVPNKNILNELKRRKFYVLSEISNVNPDFVFAHPKKISENNKVKDNVFYWNYPGLKNLNNRTELAEWLKYYFTNTKHNKYARGVFIHGKFGLGKSFFFCALLNFLIEKNKSVSYLNINELYEYMTRNLDKNSELNSDAILKMKNVDVLLIDDIGSEKQSNWFLFTIIQPVLEYRLKEEKTTCFTSLFSIQELKKYWNKNRELDQIKVERLIEKIKSLTKQIELKGKNIREIENHT